MKKDGTGFWYQYKNYYRCRLVFQCYKIKKEEYLFSDKEKMKQLHSMGFVLKVLK